MGSIIAAIAAIPQIISSLTALISLLEKKLGPDWASKITKINEAYAKFEQAKTDEDRDAALRDIASGWSS